MKPMFVLYGLYINAKKKTANGICTVGQKLIAEDVARILKYNDHEKMIC